MIKVLVCNQNAIVRRGLSEILNEQTGIQVLDAVTSEDELIKAIDRDRWDVILVDMASSGRPGLDTLKQLKTEAPGLPMVVFGNPKDTQIVTRAMRAGALGFVSRESPPHELIAAIRKAIRGEKFICNEAAQNLALQSIADSDEVTPDLLSDRELQVMLMIASGKTTKEIAYDLGLSEKTIGTYRQRILEKMRLRHNADMIRYAIEHRLLSSE